MLTRDKNSPTQCLWLVLWPQLDYCNSSFALDMVMNIKPLHSHNSQDFTTTNLVQEPHTNHCHVILELSTTADSQQAPIVKYTLTDQPAV